MHDETSITKQPPQIQIKELTFSGGQSFRFTAGEIVAFVGPNNAGKSHALREIASQLSTQPNPNPKVLTRVSPEQRGTTDDFAAFLAKNGRRVIETNGVWYRGLGFNLPEGQIRLFNDQPGSFRHLLPFFLYQVQTINRQQQSDQAHGIVLYRDPPQHPIHLLMEDQDLEAEISALFRRAYGKDLIPFRAGVSQYPLYVGGRPEREKFPDLLGSAYVKELFRLAEPLAQQGDGMRSFVSILLSCIVSSHHSIITLDEPEVFLHPPQARLLGEYLATKRRQKSQLFIATHSPDILEGLCANAIDQVRILRLVRNGSQTDAFELDPELVSRISTDPVARFSGVMNAVFHETVVITESEADSLVYSSMLNAIAKFHQKSLDVVFVRAGGKQRFVKLIRQIESVNVGIKAIVDIDILNDKRIFQDLVTAMSGDFGQIASDFRIVAEHMNQRKPETSVGAIRESVVELLDGLPQALPLPKATQSQIISQLKKGSNWTLIKATGAQLLKGPIWEAYSRIETYCAGIGLYIVPVGELEGFCPAKADLHGPGFAIEVLNSYDLMESEELINLRRFVTGIFESLPD
jgi:ABC-type multidrug transport system ATPase subunit